MAAQRTGAALLTASLLWSASGFCEEPSYSLAWVRGEGAESCPGQPRLVAEIEQRLGHAIFAAGGQRSLEASVARADDSYRVDIYVRDESGKALGHRALGSAEPSCETILSATALALALVIDPEAVARSDANAQGAVARFELVDPAPPSQREVPLPELPRPLPAAPPPDCPAADPRVARSDFSARGLITAGLVPSASPAVGLSFNGWPSERWGWAVSAYYVFEQRTADPVRGDFGVSATAATFALAAKLLAAGPFRLDASLGPTVGVLHTRVYAPRPTQPGDYALVGAQADLRARLRLTTALFAEVGGGALVQFLQRALVTEGQPPAWRQPPVAGQGFLGIGVSI